MSNALVQRRERIARIVDPDAWMMRDRYQELIESGGPPLHNEEERAAYVRSARYRAEAIVAASLVKADAIEATSAQGFSEEDVEIAACAIAAGHGLREEDRNDDTMALFRMSARIALVTVLRRRPAG
ncbi:hypothetical protein [Sphingomonas pruni]|uniref:hypothetical protein n=1 Tax=Sphingomonas pruni TaxID=40683 RepID=UPI0008337E9E|nr:hypothetical protein [Sphingomonas pruni]